MRHPMTATLLIAALSLAAAPAGAAEGMDRCSGVITSLPATLAAPGVWCLDRSLSTALASGAAITVAANDVTVDCNDFRVNGALGGIETQAVGILAVDRVNVVVRNCSLRGFQVGVRTEGGAGVVVADNRLQGNRYIGVMVHSAASTVRGNLVVDTGGNTAGPGPITGIKVAGGVDVVDNSINRVFSSITLPLAGIDSQANDGATISGNHIRRFERNSSDFTWGIRDASDRVLIDRNYVVAMFGSDPRSVGIECASARSMASRNTVTKAYFDSHIVGCDGAASGDNGNLAN